MTVRTYSICRAADLEVLADFRNLVRSACEEHPAIDSEFCYDLQLAVDEACSNVILHGYAGMNPGSMILALEIDDRQVEILLTDFGLPFEPSPPSVPDTAAILEDQSSGSFGLYFIYETMDEVEYQSSEAGNYLKLVKRFPGKSVVLESPGRRF